MILQKLILVTLFISALTSGCAYIIPVNQAPTEEKAEQVQPEGPKEKLAEKPQEVRSTVKVSELPNRTLSKELDEYCNKIDKKFKKYKWGESNCRKYNWHHVRNSVLGTPLIWKTYGDEEKHKNNYQDTTLVLCGVHGDEITPIKFCFDILEHVQEHAHQFDNNLIVIAPIVNPDSFFKRRPTRTNHRGVDINRNFPTRDWQTKALKTWKHRYRSDKRRYPGKSPMSEPEVLFQVNLILRYKPTKIISVHAPLTMLDYDGPIMQSAMKDSNGGERSKGYLASNLLSQMSSEAKGYRIKNYPYFPGSLGNFAGNERKIPTYTLELPNSDYTKHKVFWNMFRKAIHSAFLFQFLPEEKLKEGQEKRDQAKKKRLTQVKNKNRS